jgi:hypothetical protein
MTSLRAFHGAVPRHRGYAVSTMTVIEANDRDIGSEHGAIRAG